MAISGGAARHHHERHSLKEHDGDQTSGGKAQGIVNQPVALDRVADLELHYRHAGELRGKPELAISSAAVFRISPDQTAQAVAFDNFRIEREDDLRQLPVQRQQLAADNLIRLYAIDQISGSRRLAVVPPGNSASGMPPCSRGLTCREHRNDTARAVDQLEVSNQFAQFCQRFAIEQALASTTISTSNSLDGNRRVTDSYCLDFRRFGTKQLADESSTLMRPIPNAAATHSATSASVAISGNRNEIRPIRSIPSAMRCGLRRGDTEGSGRALS